MTLLEALFLLAVGTFTLTAAITDLWKRRLPNWLNVTALAAALVTHTVVNGLSGLGFALLGFVTGFGILLVLWLIGGGGGGDVKLMGALGAWLGAGLIAKVFFVSAVLIAVMAGGILLIAFVTHGFQHVKKRYMSSGSAGSKNLLGGDDRRRRRYRILPYAVPVAVGTWLVLAGAWHASSLPF